MSDTYNLNVFMPNFVVGSIIVVVATSLLLILFVKGIRTGTLQQYFIVYAILINMIVVWTCQGSLGYTYKFRGTTYRVQTSSIFLQPLSTLLFSMLYNDTIRKILEIKRYETAISLLKLLSYINIFLAVFFFGLNSQDFTSYFAKKEYQIELRLIVTIQSLIGGASCVFLSNSVIGINQFCKDTETQDR